ncbi:hypothetical protein GOBAR_AA23816 [Gossypium barbadense]|uniref:Uncharacterized protein n=1 Tax=Gossypium barbadense TaxID=3634 RepID=A0A2P5X0J9_GOSBA|nr:hypothetical protein GOBAR_AA23816 [Gossypium barbadense]
MPLLLHRLLGGDFSSTMRFCNQSSQTVAEESTITSVRRVPSSIFREVRTHTFYLYYNKPKSSVLEDLSEHVVSSRKAQVKWYGKLLQAWKEAKPSPKTPEEVARLIVETLSRHQKADVEGHTYCF